MIKIAICEPERETSGVIETLLLRAGEFLPAPLSSDIFFSGKDFLDALAEGDTFGIILADLTMGDMSGVELGLKLRQSFSESEAVLIYMSGEASFVDGIFETQPIALLKIPLDEKEFLRKIFAAYERLQKADELFTCKQGRIIHQIKKRDIICLESVGRDIILSISGREDVEYREALRNEAEKLNAINFIRPHNSFIVNLDYVEQYRTDSLLMTNKKIVPISELKLREIKQAALKFWEYRNM